MAPISLVAVAGHSLLMVEEPLLAKEERTASEQLFSLRASRRGQTELRDTISYWITTLPLFIIWIFGFSYHWSSYLDLGPLLSVLDGSKTKLQKNVLDNPPTANHNQPSTGAHCILRFPFSLATKVLQMVPSKMPHMSSWSNS